MQFQPHQQRVIDEKDELDARIDKLRAFFATPTYGQLDAQEKRRLLAQHYYMAGYSYLLGDRIKAFAQQ